MISDHNCSETPMISSILRNSLVVLLFICHWNSSGFAEPKSSRLRFPLTKIDVRPPNFLLDISEVEGIAAVEQWGDDAKDLCEEWFPVICKFLSTDDWTPPETVRIVVKKRLTAPGSTIGNTISISSKWISEHPDDFGMVIHELVHVVQNYPGSKTNPGWLVEGIADYFRYWKYESEVPRRKAAANASYRDGYGTTGSFLAWVTWKYDRRLVRRLDAALRTNEYEDGIFQETTGKTIDELWTEFLGSQEPVR